MIKFSCPSCGIVLQAQMQQAGAKFNCSKCGQRLQVPRPPRDKTILGAWVEPALEQREGASLGTTAQMPAFATSSSPVVRPQADEAQTWHYRKGGATHGPVTFSQMRSLAKGGVVSAADFVWTQGMAVWLEAAKVRGLFDESTPVCSVATLQSKTRIPLAIWCRWLISTRKGQVASLAAVLVVFAVGIVLAIRSARSPAIQVASAQTTQQASPVLPMESGTIAPAKSQPEATAEPKTIPMPPPRRLTGQEVYEKAVSSTVFIANPGRGFGSGSLVDAQKRLILTNYHVIAGAPAGGVLTAGAKRTSGLLTQADRRPGVNVPMKTFSEDFKAGEAVEIRLNSVEFDPFLMISNGKGQALAFDDDGGGDLNARIYFTPPATGNYVIAASSYDGRFGRFELIVQRIGGSTPAVPTSGAAPFVYSYFPKKQKGNIVAEKTPYISAASDEKEKAKARVLAWSEAKDLALLQVEWVPPGTPALPLSKDSCRPGEAVHSIGSPAGSGLLWAYTSGTARTGAYRKQWESTNGLTRYRHDATVIETQSPVNPGDSGGPLLNEFGEIVAMTQGGNFSL